MNSKLHVVCDSKGRLIQMYLSAGQTSDYVGAAGLLRLLPPVKCLLADRGYDADWLRSALIDTNITPCIPSKKNRKVQITHHAVLDKKRHKIENKFGCIKDWRRVAMRFNRRPEILLSAFVLNAIVAVLAMSPEPKY
jgi:transposase